MKAARRLAEATQQNTQLEKKDPWNDWDLFIEQTDLTGFMQSSWWAELRKECGYRYFGTVIRQLGRVVGGAIIQKYEFAQGKSFYYIQDGPVLPQENNLAGEVFNAIISEINRHRSKDENIVSHLRIEPRWTYFPEFIKDFQTLNAPGDPYTEPRDTLCIDLRGNYDDILSAMKPKGRYNVRLAQRRGVTVFKDSSVNGLRNFLNIYHETTQRQGISEKPLSYFLEMVSRLVLHDKGEIFLAEFAGRCIAAAIVVYSGNRATYFFGGSSDLHRHVMAPYLLHYEIMKTAKTRGCQWYDLWGIAPSGIENHPWGKITEFKRKFGGMEVNLIPTQDLVLDYEVYQEYIQDKI